MRLETRSMSEIDRRWARIGRNAAFVAGAGFLIGSVLFLLDALDLLGRSAVYHRTSAGRVQDEANFWVASFHHQHDLVWDIVGRDTLLPIAFIALIILALVLRQLAGADGPDGTLMVTFMLVGGILSIVADLLYLGATEYWRFDGWTSHPAVTTVAIGRTVQAIDTLTHWPEAAGFAVLAPALLYLGRTCRKLPVLPGASATIATIAAPVLVLIAAAGLAPWHGAYQIASLALGVILAPVLTVMIGLRLGRIAEAAPPRAQRRMEAKNRD